MAKSTPSIRNLSCVATVSLFAATAAASAQSGLVGSAIDAMKSGSLPSIPADWTITLGGEGKIFPAFEGANRYEFDPNPIFSVHRSGKAARFRSPRDGAGIALINAEGFYFGPVGKFKKARKESDHVELRGLGDVDWTLEVGAFAEYWPKDWLRARIEARRGFNGHEGFVADASADLVIPFAERWTFSGGPRLTVADTNATAPYFGIDTLQAAASGLPVFDAKGGVRSVGGGMQVRFQWTPQLATRAYLEYDHLMGDAASSPLVTERGSPDQVSFGLGVTYSFDVKLW